MNKKTMKRQRRALWGWVKWVPVVSIPFSILFFHTWLNIQILRADYVLRELDGEARDLAERLNNTGMEETIHEDPNMLSEQAKLMDFVQPSPGQRESIPWRQLAYPEDSNFAVAQLDGVAQPDPGATESLTDQSRTTTAADATSPSESESVNDAPATEAETVATPGDTAPALSVPLASTDGGASAVVTPTSAEVVLDLPEEPKKEDVVELESAMESLESL